MHCVKYARIRVFIDLFSFLIWENMGQRKPIFIVCIGLSPPLLLLFFAMSLLNLKIVQAPFLGNYPLYISFCKLFSLLNISEFSLFFR